MNDDVLEIFTRLEALGNLISALRDRVDAELKLTHNWLEGVEAKLTRLEKRIDESEARLHVPPAAMDEIEKSSREEEST